MTDLVSAPRVSSLVASGADSVVVGDLSSPAPVVSTSTPVVEVDRLFRADRRLRAVIVRSSRGAALLTRENLDYELSGPFGYGRSLRTGSTVDDLPIHTDLVLPSSLKLGDAANLVLDRDVDRRYQDVLVDDPEGYLVVPVSLIFEHLAAAFRHVAYHDPLTGLPNRRLLDDTAHGLTEAGIDTSRLAILYIDLDGFKLVNDSFGHRIGDELLVEFSERMRACVRPNDVIARLGGDEFAALLTDVSEVQATAIADRIVLTASAPFLCDDQPVYISASVGLAMADDVRSETELRTVDVLLRHADEAMLHAKRSGKRQVKRLSGAAPALDIARRGLIRRRLGAALKSGSTFELHYQPKLDLTTRTMHTVEALLRWNDPELGPVGPAEFIPIAEETNQIERIGRWVLDRACAQAKVWSDAGRPRSISVNISPVQFARGTVVEDLRAALRNHELPPELLRIEITEGAAVLDLATAVAQLRQIRAAGIHVELDDFGVGYASLAMLRDLPLTAVKVDKTFVDTVDTDDTGPLIIKGVIDIAHALGLTVVAEGVERQTQLDILAGIGCDSVQGYLIARPSRASAL